MNSQEYIASGVLDLYVSGLLSIEEMRDVELHACQDATVKTELEALQLTMERFALKYSMPPRAEVKQRIMRAISGEQESGKKVTSINRNVTDSENKEHLTDPVIREIPASRYSYSGLLAAASLVLVAIMGATTFYFYNQYQEANSEVAQLQKEQAGIQKQVDNLQTAMNEDASKMQVLTDANTVRITMKGTDKSPASMALIYWNKVTQAVYLDIKALPPASPDRQYQLWFIDPKKGPVSAGVFDVKTDNLIKMINASDAATFAVTLEPRGGSINPTLDQMYVVGNVNS